MEKKNVKIIRNSLNKCLIELNADVTIASDILQSTNDFKNLLGKVKCGGFIITSESANISKCILDNYNIINISLYYVDNRALYLLRKVRLLVLTYYKFIITH